MLEAFSSSKELPPYEELFSLLEKTGSIMEEEVTSYRPKDKNGKPGGLLDFTKNYSSIPVIVVPDLHARIPLILKLMDFKIQGKTVLELLEKKEILVCCVGDIFHSERRGKERWQKAYQECERGNPLNEFLTEEMVENLRLLEMLLVLKANCKENFHILKGNHENILNEDHIEKYGNLPFKKFCDEGKMVTVFMRNFYDDLILHEISCFEKSLPVCAAFENCVVSHAEPEVFYSREEIINYHEEKSRVSYALTWTANGEAEEGSVKKIISELLPLKFRKNALFITGHRPVAEKYALRQQGLLVQIHNPEEMQVALINGKKFNPEEDIIRL